MPISKIVYTPDLTFITGTEGNDAIVSGLLILDHNGPGVPDWFPSLGQLNSRIDGLGGNDLLRGGLGDDSVSGGDGNDTLRAGAGDDSLYGGAGADSMAAGPTGEDFYQYKDRTDTGLGAGSDTIFQWNDGDHIDVSRLNVKFIGSASFASVDTNPAWGEMRVIQQGGNTLVKFDYDDAGGAESAIVILGLQDLTAADFIL